MRQFKPWETTNELEPVAPPQSPASLAAEIEQIPAEQLLVESGPYRCFLTPAAPVPHLLYEIGRLRELTFRAAGEGTGAAVDLDWFDCTYLHVVLWKRDTREVVGAYRLGQTDVLLPRFGQSGLYTSTLFTYEPELLHYLTPALELGRSFVRREYQKSYAALFLLWKGIAQFVVRHPRYNRLFGAVSLSKTYTPLSRQLLMAFLQLHKFQPDLARLVHAKHPPFLLPPTTWSRGRYRLQGKDAADVAAWIAEIDAEQRGIPILLKQYLRLGGRVLGFNRDARFGDVIDGLMLVDLTQTDRTVLERYMGKQGAASFLAYHHEKTAYCV
ncbi:MAG: GNAT family N-acetyltransferase [Candidatus Binatia bacterium]|nr:GNAT family N-acetyltransferase [Candidatus Binatia bacterium]